MSFNWIVAPAYVVHKMNVAFRAGYASGYDDAIAVLSYARRTVEPLH